MENRTLDPEKILGRSYFCRVDSNDVAEWLNTVLGDILFASLLLKKSTFSFVDVATGTVSFGGPIMLKFALSNLDPNFVVGIELL